MVPMSAALSECLWEYLNSRLPLKHPAVFLNRYLNRLTPNTLKRTLRRLRSKAGIEQNITPHVLRHTCASLLIQGTDIVTVKELLGHEDISTTALYSHTNPSRMAEAVNSIAFSDMD